MSRDGRRDFGLIILTCIVACLLVATIAIALATRSDLSTDNRQIAQLQQEIATVRASVNGSHRDLITCGDLQNLGWTLSGTDSSGGLISGIAGPAPESLPGHCINR